MANRRLTPGKVRRLQTAASPAGVFQILAIDHCGVLLKMMGRGDGSQVPADDVTRLKLDVVRHVGPLATAVLLDPEFSAFQAIQSGALPGNVGLLIQLENERLLGSSPDPDPLLVAWSVRQARQVGASGIKLYLPYHPDAGDRTAAQENLVRSIIRQCDIEALPLFLEPINASIDPAAPTDSVRFARERLRVAIKTVERLGALGPDVLKLEFPVDHRHVPDEAVWRAACAELSDASPVPWALLSAGDPFEVFKTQLQIACEAGCSGFMAGRAVWREVATTSEPERAALIKLTVGPRMEVLNQIAHRYGHGWQEKCPPAAFEMDWPESY
jgi:tagatose 1,6-diphosphate aldolase